MSGAVVMATAIAAVIVIETVASPAAAATNHLSGSNVAVLSATDAAPIGAFKYIINLDNTGTTEQRTPADGCSPEDPGYPASCNWTSMGTTSSSPVVTQGTEADFAAGFDLADGRYLISVLADGYKLDGAHFTMPLDGTLTVLMQPTPLPDATIQAAVFEDISPVNSAPDLPAEHGLAGFTATLNDVLGQITTDVYGSPLCGDGTCESYCYVVDGGVDLGITKPLATGRCPIVPQDLDVGEPTGLFYTTAQYPTPAQLNAAGNPVPPTAAIEGKVKIPNVGTNRFTMLMTPPDGTNFMQSTTLEGNHDWDTWIMEGADGLDTEFTMAGEPFPTPIFGFVPMGVNTLPAGNGSITGVVDAVKIYVPANTGIAAGGTIWGGMNGGVVDKPIDSPLVTLTDLGNGDTLVWSGRGDVNGRFTIPNVPDGNYTLTWWDEAQNYILDLQQVTVANGETVDMGILPLTGWWTYYDGYVFNDANRNGTMDWSDANGNACPDAGEGELGVPQFTLVMRKRDNSLMDRGSRVVATDACGHYQFEAGYPLTQWVVMEAYSDAFYTTGVTYQADNQPTPTTVLGNGVDVNTLPIIGLAGRMDWGVHAYDARGTNGVDPRNGGIVGTVSYDTTRNELDARFAAVEDWQPGVAGMTVELSEPVACLDGNGDPQPPCDPTETYRLNPDGSYMSGPVINTTVTETWENPGLNDDSECIPRDADGNELVYGPNGQQITNNHKDCLEAPLMGVQFQKGFATVDGNYGFGDACFPPNVFDPSADPDNPCKDVNGAPVDMQALPGGRDYLVKVVSPMDPVHTDRPLYQVTREEDINVAYGDDFVPQIPPPACAGALHQVDVAGLGSDGYAALPGNGSNGAPAGVTVPASAPTDNAPFVDMGGSPYEGMPMPSCDTKLVPLANGKSIAPTFNVFTDVPLPTRFWGLIVDDLNFSSDPHQINYGEKSGVPFAPVGIYDYTNRLVHTVESDYSGLWDVLMPSTNRINCPTPSGVCANLYRFVGNDPGAPGALNANYRPEFRTISAEFEAIPGVNIVADLAPTQVGVTVQLPGGQRTYVQCLTPASQPQLMAVNVPYVNDTGSFTIQGLGFGATTGQVTLDGVAIPTTAWNDTTITATVPTTIAAGPHQLMVTTAAGLTTVNGLTFHVLRTPTAPAYTASTVLDNFNRAGQALYLGFSGNWSIAAGYRVNGNAGQIGTGATSLLPELWTGATFGGNQEAWVTLTEVSSAANRQGIVLKSTTGSRIFVFRLNATTVRVQTLDTTNGFVNQADIAAGLTNGEQLGARALADGTVEVYEGTTLRGSVNVKTTATPWTTDPAVGGAIGLTFNGTNNTAAGDARVDNFGGGNITIPAGGTYQPNLYEVGPGKPHATIQSAVNAASASNGDDLVVVYPGTATTFSNPRGAYFENVILSTPVKLQGVGPGGNRNGSTVAGSIIDASAFAGDGPVAANWYTLLDSLTWDGNQTIYDGAAVSIYTHDGTFGQTYKGAIDGFDLRGGDQQGFPGNLNVIGGTPTGLPANLITQGGAVFANAYARYLQVTNNVVESNGGAYGTIRIGTPDVAAGENQNTDVRIANNRIIANGGTNLAGGIGIFAESDRYQVTGNDICGNFSAEYGGGLTVYGRSPNGSIDHNRIWFNQSYDEGGGVMIAGALPANPAQNLSPGTGPVSIHDNVIQSNMSNDDGGGIRFLMAGTGQMDVYNNVLANNVSTHEGGGISLNDTTDVRFFNNTVMKNVTTATAVTSNGSPAPAGLSTSRNSDLLQAALPGGSPVFSNPVLFNNIFWDNRAGARAVDQVVGIGAPGDTAAINHWDLGVSDGSGSVSITNSVVQGGGTGWTGDATNSSADPLVVQPYDTQVSFTGWRTNPNFIGAILITLNLPPDLLGNYHLQSSSVSAIDRGAASKAGSNAPTTDIDGQNRTGNPDAGADEVVGAVAAFPVNATPLDQFGSALGGRWTSPQTGYLATGGTMWAFSGTSATVPLRWAAGTFGANQEAYFTFTDVATAAGVRQGVVLKYRSGSSIRVVYDRTAGNVRVETTATSQNGGNPVLRGTVTASFANGDRFGAQTTADGSVRIYKGTTLIGTVSLASGASPWPSALRTGGGAIGVMFTGTTGNSSSNSAGNARIDNFGGGNI